jgi:hypothetical protein
MSKAALPLDNANAMAGYLRAQVLRTGDRFMDSVSDHRPDPIDICQNANAYVDALRRYRRAVFLEYFPLNGNGVCRRRKL